MRKMRRAARTIGSEGRRERRVLEGALGARTEVPPHPGESASGVPVGPDKVAWYSSYPTGFRAALSEHQGLKHDHAYLMERGRRPEAARLAIHMVHDLLRPASRPVAAREEAGVKLALIQAVGATEPLAAAMLGAAALIECARWSFGTGQRLAWSNALDVPLAGAAERCAAYASAPDPTSAGLHLGIAEARWRDLAALRCGPQAARTGCFAALVDRGLAATSIPARDRSEAHRKLEFAAELIGLLGDARSLPSAMLEAAVRVDCERWGIEVIDLVEDLPDVRH